MRTWMANFEGNEIKITYTMRRGYELYVRAELQDISGYSGYGSAILTGHIQNFKGERLKIKVRFYGTFGSRPMLFVDDKLVESTKQ